ncbi:MAG: gliding motility-associated C-terminal domain-containing protein [Prolixibacteraceae bacterium]|jgi:gliding motility-associated-like protein|nr:gliding motility-associated C-terminal domain-containing protein [Prolixibacteraceae bacterium]
MNKIILVLISLLMLNSSFAQKGKVVSALNFKEAGKLEQAFKTIQTTIDQNNEKVKSTSEIDKIIIQTKNKYNSNKSDSPIVGDELITKRNSANKNIIVPNGFSPNGDGVHDVFEVRGLEKQYPNFEMKIFNSNRDLIWEYKHNGNPNSKPEWWNGKDNTNNIKKGTYSYIIEFNEDSTKKRSGNLMLSK